MIRLHWLYILFSLNQQQRGAASTCVHSSLGAKLVANQRLTTVALLLPRNEKSSRAYKGGPASGNSYRNQNTSAEVFWSCVLSTPLIFAQLLVTLPQRQG